MIEVEILTKHFDLELEVQLELCKVIKLDQQA
jgi:hypothetical protein